MEIVHLMNKEGMSTIASKEEYIDGHPTLTIFEFEPEAHYSIDGKEIDKRKKRGIISLVFHNPISVDILIEKLNNIKRAL